MADFHQTGVITTLHRLGQLDVHRLERELLQYSSSRPIALVLPCLISELHGPGLKGIVDTLRGVNYLRQIVVSISGTDDRSGYEEMREMFDGVTTLDGKAPVLLWNSGARVQALYETLRGEGLAPISAGKGQSTWLASGYVLATDVSRVIAIHDCDIREYSRELLARLCFPTANPNLHYEFAKGYYGRVADRLYGRVTRLFVTPLLRAMKAVLGTHPLLEFLDSFRYPLAGECSMTTELARINRIPSDWGLEIGTLAEVYRNCSLKRVCQVELVENYDHRHQNLSVDDASKGLHRMVVDIASSAIRNLASYGVEFDSGFLNTLVAAYKRTAQDAIASYSDDALLNGLAFDRHEEELAVDTFTRALNAAGLGFVRDPLGMPQIPNWNRVISALPEFLDELREAVEADASESD
ncbi:MAG: glycosyl transferase [Deltaproteobacteria bacterium]|nr:glycosyl transferase [Deltaproteobacteria bacterium]MBW2666724.1 glycosyl transferase [Deltaproteobacteria bacterium]